MKILYTSAEVHDAIKAILSSPRIGERRVIVVAYIGKNAEAFLPHPDGLEIVCALQPGATSADALIRLRERGALILQSDRLHMKVYLSSNRGSIVCSANVSLHALGRKGLREAGVFLPPGAVEIGRLLKYVRPRPISDADLRKLARASDRLSAGRPQSRSSSEPASLREWLASEGRKKWKLGWWDEEGTIAKVVKAEAQARYGIAEPASALNCRKKDHRAGDWVLEFKR